MALRFLADHCISNSIVQSLQEADHEVVRLRDVLPVESPDVVVIEKAQEHRPVVPQRRLRRYRHLPTQKLQRNRRPTVAQPSGNPSPTSRQASCLFEGAFGHGRLPWQAIGRGGGPHPHS